MERLLDLGGRVDAREPYEHPGTLSIWDAAYRRCDETDEWHHDTSVVDLLESRHGNPYEGIRDEKNASFMIPFHFTQSISGPITQ